MALLYAMCNDTTEETDLSTQYLDVMAIPVYSSLGSRKFFWIFANWLSVFRTT